MATITVENGKRIEELIDINRIGDDSYFVVSDSALTRKINLMNLRNAFNGDSANSNLGNVYYSVEKINELLDHVYDELTKINGRLDNMEDRINKIYNDFGANLSEFKKYVESVFAELRLADKNLDTKIDQTKLELNNKIDATKTELDNKIDTVNNNLTEKINTVNTTLNNKIDQTKTDLTNTINQTKQELNNKIDNTKTELNNKIDSVNNALDARLLVVEAKLANITRIDIGVEVPTTLEHNVIYLQYF